MTVLFLDTESYSDIPIRDGVHRYSESVEITVASWAFDDEPEDVVDLTLGGGLPRRVIDAIRDPAVTIVGHNFGMFDRTVLRAAGLDIPADRIWDTMVQALAHGLPGSLERLGEIFGISEDQAKLASGKALIQLFCKPRPKNMALRRATRATHPADWSDFLEYAKRDIPAMRFLYRNMPRWNYPGDRTANGYRGEYDNWLLDQAINDRGMRVDTDLARAAIDAVNKAQKVLDARTAEMTDDEVARTSQRDKLLAHLLAEYGVTLPDMAKSTLERRLNDDNLPDAVRELIANRLESATTSNSKYNALLRSVSRDGRLRGTLQFCGAARTGRDSGRLFQPQNLKRPDMAQADIEMGISALKAGTAHLLFDSPIKLASNAIRGCIIADEGKKLIVGDYNQIEARVLPWLAGQKTILDDFRAADAGEGADYYSTTYARSFGVTPEAVTANKKSGGIWRQIGKVIVLSCGYGGSVGAFNSFAALYGVEMPDSQVKETVDRWRAANPAIADWDNGLWALLNRAAFDAMRAPGQTFDVNGKMTFEKWRAWLRFTLPSGRTLCYADPQIIEDPRMPGKMTLSYMGLNSYTRKWERLTTYGGKLSADATQATARDIMWNGVQNLERAGYNPISRIHDEAVCETLDSDKFTVAGMIAEMVRRPWWIDDVLPLAADGFEGPRYRKGD